MSKIQTLIAILVGGVACSPLSALACGKGEAIVFSCTTDNGVNVQICQGKNNVRYAFGKHGNSSGASVLVSNSNFVWHSSPGSSIDTTDMEFEGEGARYVVSATRYRDEDFELGGEVRVEKEGGQVETLVCRDESVRFSERAIKSPKTPL